MVKKITDDGINAYYQASLEGNKKARSHLYVREMKSKSGGVEYKVHTTNSPFFMKILHVFTRISTKYFYGQDAIDKIVEKKLIPDLIKKEEPKKKPVVEQPPSETELPPETEEMSNDGFEKYDLSKLVDVVPTKNDELTDDGFQKYDPNDFVDVIPEEKPFSFSGWINEWTDKLVQFFTPTKQQVQAEELYLNPQLKSSNLISITNEAKELAKKFARISPPSSFKVRGQENLGNTCYINSSLQCLETVYGVHDPDCKALIREDLSLREGEDLKGLESRLLNRWVPLKNEEDILFKWTYLLLLQAKLKGTTADIEQTLRLHHKLFFVTNPHQDFRREIFGQKDSAEYFEHFLDILGPKTVTVSDVLSAEIEGQKVEEKPKIDPGSNLIHINIDKKEHTTLVSRILEGCREVIQEAKSFDLPDNSQAWALSYTKSTRYANPPNSLHLHIVRFENDKANTKKNYSKLEMKDIDKPIDLTPIFDKEAKYQLTSFNVHQGDLNSGHYVAYALRDGKWHYISDTTEHEVEQSKVPFGDAYIMNFIKI